MKTVALSGLVAYLVCGAAICGEVSQSSPKGDADWPQFRGPERNGVVTGGPALANEWPASGLFKVWESEALPHQLKGTGGYSAPTVADGRVYQYMHYQRFDAVENMTKFEVNAETAKVPEDMLKQWATKGVSSEILEKLKLIDLGWSCDVDAWFDKNKIPDDVRKLVREALPNFGKAREVFMCFDASNGKTLWKKEYEGVAFHRDGAGSTITVSGGRCYIAASGVAYCLDAKDGREIWKQSGMWTRIKSRNHYYYASSFLVDDGIALVLAAPLVAFDAEKGTVLWSQPKVDSHLASPVLWRKDGKTYVLCSSPEKITCVEIKTGNVVWEIQNDWSVINSDGTPAVFGDRMVIITNNRGGQQGLRCYSLSPNKAELAWFNKDVPMVNEASQALIYNGHVYAYDNGRLVCVKLDNGAMAWEQKLSKLGYYDQWRFPVVVDGKLFMTLNDGNAGGDLCNKIVMVDASPEKYTELGRASINAISILSPVIAGGRLYARNNNNIVCYELPKKQ